MTDHFHLQAIDIHKTFLEEKYSSRDCQDVIAATLDFYKKVGYYLPWVGYLVIHDHHIVGAAGFNGKPLNNTVEISYYTFPEFERKGFASLACKALIHVAKQANLHFIITAKTAPEENASTSILKKNGFVFKEVVQDHEIGDAWLWELMP